MGAIKTCVDRGVTGIRILGDSKIVTDWANRVSKIGYLIPNPLMEKIREVRSRLDEILFQHVYRELNEQLSLRDRSTLYCWSVILC